MGNVYNSLLLVGSWLRVGIVDLTSEVYYKEWVSFVSKNLFDD